MSAEGTPPPPDQMPPIGYGGLIASLGVLALGLLLCTVFHAGNLRSRPLVIPLDGHRALAARAYMPLDRPPPHPVMVLCHGVSSTKETLAPLAVELARRGIAALVFDFGGYGESYPRPDSDEDSLADARAVVRFVREAPQRWDADRIGIAGHSMGGTAALAMGVEDGRLQTTVLMGMSGPATPLAPRNLLLEIGLYEEFHPVWEMLAMLNQAGGAEWNAAPVGDFARGSARRLVISTSADHLIEPYDPVLIGEAAAWAARSFRLPVEELPVVVPWYILGLLLTFAGGIAGFTCLLATTGRRVVPRLRELHRRFVPCTLAVMLAITWLQGLYKPGAEIRAANLMLFFYALMLVADFALARPGRVAPVLRVAGLYAALALVIFSLTMLVNKVGLFLANPAWLAGFPRYVAQWPLDLTYNRFLQARAFLFPRYSLELHPSFLFLLLVLVEVMRPGITLGFLAGGAAWVVRSLRHTPGQAVRAASSGRAAVLLACLLALLAGILYQRWQAGLLSPAAGGVALRVVGQVVLLPLLLIALIVRSERFQRLERRCLSLGASELPGPSSPAAGGS